MHRKAGKVSNLYKIGHFTSTGFHNITDGTWPYCRGFADGYNMLSDVNAAVVAVVVASSERCMCGPDRQEIRQEEDKWFKARTGCLRYNNWDEQLKAQAL